MGASQRSASGNLGGFFFTSRRNPCTCWVPVRASSIHRNLSKLASSQQQDYAACFCCVAHVISYFQAYPDAILEGVFSECNVLLNYNEAPVRVTFRREDVIRDYEFSVNDIMVKPAGLRSGLRCHVVILFLEACAVCYVFDGPQRSIRRRISG